jgi:Ca2+ transporting ATPase
MAVIVVVMVGSINNYVKEKEFRELKCSLDKNRNVMLMRNGQSVSLPEGDILVGDIMKVEEGMTIPTDCILIQGNNVSVDESAMTGEIDLIEKATLEECIQMKEDFLMKNPNYNYNIPESSHHHIKSPIISSGTQIASGAGHVLIIAVGPNSENGKILATIEANKNSEEGTPLEQKLANIATFIGKLGLTAAIITSVALSIRTAIMFSKIPFTANDSKHIIHIFIIGVVVVVVAIPEGLPLAVTITLAFSIKKMLKDNNFVRRMEACETMGGANYICTDKTGTLTKNEMNIAKFYDGSNEYNLEHTITTDFKGQYKQYFSDQLWMLLKLSFACNSATEFDNEGKEVATFKTDLTFTKFLKKFNEDIIFLRQQYIQKIDGQIPRIAFSSKRKKMSTILKWEQFPTGYRIFMKGGSEIVLDTCQYYLNENSRRTDLDDLRRESLNLKIKDFASQSLRTICLCYKDLTEKEVKDWNKKVTITEGNGKREIHPIEEDGMTLIGIVGVKDILKDGVKDAVEKCKIAGITVIMVTGDNIDTATAIARDCNIANDIKQSMLGEKFVEKIGGVVCENCFPMKLFLQRYEEMKSQKRNRKAGDYKLLTEGLNYKCECYRTKDEALLKIKAKLKEQAIKDDGDNYNITMRDPIKKEKFEKDLEEQAKNDLKKMNAKIKNECIANIDKFERIVKKIRVIARSQPVHKYALVLGLKQLKNVVSVTVRISLTI